MKLEGSLDTFPIRELIDMVVYSSVTGVLNIYGPGEAGHLYFRDSVLYHVERRPAVGVDALAELIELARGNFSFVSDAVSDQESLYGPLVSQLQAAEQLAARWRQIRPYVPSLDMIPLLVVARDAAARRISPAVHTVLAAVDGKASLRQIAASLGWSEVDIAEAVAQMSLDGLVELQAIRRPGGLTPGAHSAHDSGHGGEGIFDRILARTARDPGDSAARTSESTQRSSSEDLILRMLRGSS